MPHSEDHAGSGGRARERTIRKYVDEAQSGDGKRSAKPRSRRHPSSNPKPRGTGYEGAKSTEREGESGEKQYGAPLSTPKPKERKKK